MTPAAARRPVQLSFWQQWRSNIFRAPWFFLNTAFFGTLALIASLFAKTGRTQHRIAQVWARCCVRISGARLIVRGEDNLRRNPVAVYAANQPQLETEGAAA